MNLKPELIDRVVNVYHPHGEKSKQNPMARLLSSLEGEAETEQQAEKLKTPEPQFLKRKSYRSLFEQVSSIETMESFWSLKWESFFSLMQMFLISPNLIPANQSPLHQRLELVLAQAVEQKEFPEINRADFSLFWVNLDKQIWKSEILDRVLGAHEKINAQILKSVFPLMAAWNQLSLVNRRIENISQGVAMPVFSKEQLAGLTRAAQNYIPEFDVKNRMDWLKIRKIWSTQFLKGSFRVWIENTLALEFSVYMLLCMLASVTETAAAAVFCRIPENVETLPWSAESAFKSTAWVSDQNMEQIFNWLATLKIS